MNEVKLNLGSGNKPLAGYWNLDIKEGRSVYPLDAYPDDAVDEVRASHVLEHFSHLEVQNVVNEWARVLKPGGKLKVAVPDFDWIVKAYQNGGRDHPVLECYLFGGQLDENGYHKSFFNAAKLTRLLWNAGLDGVRAWKSDANDCSAYEVSLNLEGVKPAVVAYNITTPCYEFLKDARGVIHVGANTGQERDIYAGYDLPVLWIEADGNAYQKLLGNIADYPKQVALHYLIVDEDLKEVVFHVANDDGKSSSLFEFAEHSELWPDVRYVRSWVEHGMSLKYILDNYALGPPEPDTLILDVQGAELLVLKGAGELLDKFRFIRAEAYDFELYKGGCQLKDLDEFLTARGFVKAQTWQYHDAERPKVSGLYEVLYERRANG